MAAGQAYNDRNHEDVSRANAEAEALLNDLNAWPEDDEEDGDGEPGGFYGGGEER